LRLGLSLPYLGDRSTTERLLLSYFDLASMKRLRGRTMIYQATSAELWTIQRALNQKGAPWIYLTLLWATRIMPNWHLCALPDPGTYVPGKTTPIPNAFMFFPAHEHAGHGSLRIWTSKNELDVLRFGKTLSCYQSAVSFPSAPCRPTHHRLVELALGYFRTLHWRPCSLSIAMARCHPYQSLNDLPQKW